ncbi:MULTISPECIES: hypothetical protein [Bacillus cereus group]|uniref:hypothetical protein n=2 Tax=Bacillus cereus group TaxID=86661 RepID=UPI000A3BEAEE|nr:hypothetical protein [Bacillus thuringiensis]AZR80730.1 hypothetical protein BtSCAC15_31935 [Bacillus thuringiensis]OTW55501.1 hypothetical protein BK703_16470 [Bacillus thuringiensis serovar silo]OTW70655.1 hypothetical protein BK700_06020 [Bacillus thuringiensis serovar toguchini]PDZ43679.1 hypothetical protein CON82_22320 [Bacillus wiedmannii]
MEELKMLAQNYAINQVLLRLNTNTDININLLYEAFKQVIYDKGVEARDTQLGALLQGIMAKTPTKQEVVTLIKAALSCQEFTPKKVNLPTGEILVGLAGSGKKGVKTINISTPAAIVAASAGAYIAKVGSHSTSSLTGSSDFMELLGLHYTDFNKSEENLLKTGFGFFSIENTIPRFDQVYGQKMFVPNPLSFAFPAIISPVQYDAILYGLSHPNLVLSKEVFELLGMKKGMIVGSTENNLHFIDEFGLFKHNYFSIIGEENTIHEFIPEKELHMPSYNIHDLKTGQTALQNVQIALDVLAGTANPIYEDVIAINAACILRLSGKANTIAEGYYMAKKHIKEGQALEKLSEIKEAYKK